MQTLPLLQSGDEIEIIAPASRLSDQQLTNLRDLLQSWGLHCIVENTIFGKDLLCANSDEQRLQSLIRSLTRSNTKAVICARGGYGSMRLIPHLAKLAPIKMNKLFVGMSDITALHLFLQQHWQWKTIHGALSQDKFSVESIATTKAFLFGERKDIYFTGKPLNHLAEKPNTTIQACITGGNLCLIQNSIGTLWQVDAKNKILFLEEVGERGYRIDRMLAHLQQAGIFNAARAVILGDFTEGNEKNGTSLVEPVLKRFAEQATIPVIKVDGIGHGQQNFPLPLGSEVMLHLGEKANLHCVR